MSVFNFPVDIHCWSCAPLCLWPTPSRAQSHRAESRSSPDPTLLARASTSNRCESQDNSVRTRFIISVYTSQLLQNQLYCFGLLVSVDMTQCVCTSVSCLPEIGLSLTFGRLWSNRDFFCFCFPVATLCNQLCSTC